MDSILYYFSFFVENKINKTGVCVCVCVKVHFKHYRIKIISINNFNWLFVVALTARSYRDCHLFLFGNSTLFIH